MNNKRAIINMTLIRLAEIRDEAIKKATKDIKEENRMKSNTEIEALVSKAVVSIMQIYERASQPLREQQIDLNDFEWQGIE